MLGIWKGANNNHLDHLPQTIIAKHSNYQPYIEYWRTVHKIFILSESLKSLKYDDRIQSVQGNNSPVLSYHRELNRLISISLKETGFFVFVVGLVGWKPEESVVCLVSMATSCQLHNGSTQVDVQGRVHHISRTPETKQVKHYRLGRKNAHMLEGLIY